MGLQMKRRSDKVKKKIWTLVLAAAVSASLLAGCGAKAEPVISESVEGNEETSESTEAECEHDWVEATCQEPKHCSKCGETEGTKLDHAWTEATFAAPKTCTLCGETEGERTQSYFEEHGVEVPDAPVSCTVDAVIYNPDNPEKFQRVVDCVWEQTDCYTEPADEDGYQLVHLEMVNTTQLYYDVAEGGDYYRNWLSLAVYDWYTGRMLPARNMKDDDASEYIISLEIGGDSYDVSYTKDLQWEQDDWVHDDAGNGSSNLKGISSYVFKVPEGYDGLVFAAIPKREYTEDSEDTETVSGVEEAEYAPMDENDEYYVEGIKYFRINRSDDSAIMTGANAASSASAGSTSDGAVVDESRAQGSVGESGLPYYKVGFSPKDFTIGGLSIYDGKTVDEMFDAVDLPDWADTNGSVEGWYKKQGANGATMFGLTEANGSASLVYYTNEPEKIEMQFFNTAGYTIAGADFIQSQIIPGETTFAEAVDALGIRDVITAMGIQGDAFKDASLDFESQFSEETKVSVSWREDGGSVNIYWSDKDGKVVTLHFQGEGNIIDYLRISREN